MGRSPGDTGILEQAKATPPTVRGYKSSTGGAQKATPLGFHPAQESDDTRTYSVAWGSSRLVFEPQFGRWLLQQIVASPVDPRDCVNFRFFRFNQMPPDGLHDFGSLMRANLTPELLNELKDARTTKGYTLSNAIQGGILCPQFPVGFSCGDEESYDLFKVLLNKIIKQAHSVDPEKHRHKSDLSFSKLVFSHDQVHASPAFAACGIPVSILPPTFSEMSPCRPPCPSCRRTPSMSRSYGPALAPRATSRGTLCPRELARRVPSYSQLFPTPTPPTFERSCLQTFLLPRRSAGKSWTSSAMPSPHFPQPSTVWHCNPVLSSAHASSIPPTPPPFLLIQGSDHNRVHKPLPCAGDLVTFAIPQGPTIRSRASPRITWKKSTTTATLSSR